MDYRLTISAAPEKEPVSLEEMLVYLKIDTTVEAEESVIAGMIATARMIAEQYTGLCFISRTISLFMDRWPQDRRTAWWDGMREGAIGSDIREIEMPLPPLREIIKIKVYDEADNTTNILMDNLYVDNAGLPGRIVLKKGYSLPMPGRPANGIEISYTAGYGGEPEDVPAIIRQAIRQLVAYMYENRGEDADVALKRSGAVTLLQPYRQMRLA